MNEALLEVPTVRSATPCNTSSLPMRATSQQSPRNLRQSLYQKALSRSRNWLPGSGKQARAGRFWLRILTLRAERSPLGTGGACPPPFRWLKRSITQTTTEVTCCLCSGLTASNLLAWT